MTEPQPRNTVDDKTWTKVDMHDKRRHVDPNRELRFKFDKHIRDMSRNHKQN